MTRNLKPYPAYKDSGVPWLGEIPAHWEIKRQRNIVDMLVSNVDKLSVDGEAPVRLCNYVDVYKNDHITERIQFMRATASATEIDRFRLRLGDVLITKDSESWNDIGVPSLVEYVAEDLICGYHLALLRPRLALLRPRPNILIGSFLLRAIQSRGVSIQYHIAANGVTRYGLSQDAIKSVLVPIPSLEEQHRIAAFLTHIDRRVNRFIRAKRRMIALLNEQKQAIIHRAVTRGLDPDVKLKPSGVAWLGEVPEHWKATRLKYVAKVQTGITLGKSYGGIPLKNRPYLRVANVQDGYLDLKEITTVNVPASEIISYELRFGDVLMTEGGDIDKLGRGCIWRGEILGCLHQNHIFAVRADHSQLLPEFLILLMTSRHGRMYFQITAKKQQI
ncbi:restriction endonuclease subunit S [Candidatus Chloroploca sp. Khr17]|uniref:restriction endonuclease subunit S n=1 Tax=Candidatus Chloroploca sp. Khr17 TaxID=2496869 RepID=UPI00101CA23D|nr:restriction endonuclease subunit S [Candidatus Chloroploca sp. Khr17]